MAVQQREAWLVCSARPLTAPGVLIGWLRATASPPLLLIDTVVSEEEYARFPPIAVNDDALGQRGAIGSIEPPGRRISHGQVQLTLQPLTVIFKRISYPAIFVHGKLSYITPSLELRGHAGMCARLLARSRSPPRPLDAVLARLQDVDFSQRLSSSLTRLLPATLFPNLRTATLHPRSPSTWAGDRLLGLLMAIVIFVSTPMLASFLVAAVTTFLSHYCGLLDSLIAAGVGPGVWGIKLNGALISSTGQLWYKLRTLITFWLPPAHDIGWPQGAKLLLYWVSTYTGSCGGWIAGVSLLTDAARLIFLPLFYLQWVIATAFAFEVSSLITLSRLLIGRKYNVLRLRVDSHDFDMEHYTLGTVFFTLLFFLFPTIVFIHAFVAAPLLFVVYPILVAVKMLAYLPSRIPLSSLLLWVLRSDRIAVGISLRPSAAGLELRTQLPSLTRVLHPLFEVHMQPLLALFPAFFLGKPLAF